MLFSVTVAGPVTVKRLAPIRSRGIKFMAIMHSLSTSKKLMNAGWHRSAINGFHQSGNMGLSTIFEGLEIEGLEEKGSMRLAWDAVDDTCRFL